ncbi:MAG: M20/M25/M40 family metallo-hydrolase [Chloroflexi bacterium]|nr:M20/M25/M40 family metallo-hydrolase [Chloroflexota bacterium]
MPVDILAHLKTLVAAPGLSGYESPVRDLIREAWMPLTNELGGDNLGSLWATKHGSGKKPRKTLMLSAHMDAIGLMVKRVHEGFLWVTEIGGVDARVMPGQPVLVHGKEILPGLVTSTPPHLLSPADRDRAVKLDDLMIDVGLPAERVGELVRVGDLISFGQTAFEMNDWLVAKSLDNRASVAAVTACLDVLQTRQHSWDVVAVATAQEEETLGGAFTSAFGLNPDLAIAIDVTFASGPGLPDHKTFSLGDGPTLGWGPNLHPKLHKAILDIAAKSEIPCRVEIMPMHSGTDAYAIQVSRDGIPTAVIGLPLKHMHTPVEVVSLKDIIRAGRLMAEFIARLNDDFLMSLSLD